MLSQNWILTSTVIISSMTSACASSLRVVTLPAGADVYLVEGQSRQENPVGQTPLEIQPAAFGEFISLEIERQGYKSLRVVYPSISGYSGELSLALLPRLASEKQADLLKTHRSTLNSMVSDIFLLQERILSRNIEQASELVQRMEESYSELAVFQVLRGNLALLQGNRELALLSYRKALALDPQNRSAQFFLRSLGASTEPAQQDSNPGGQP
jgi:tetratricopeptide (TPR) repeat protein